MFAFMPEAIGDERGGWRIMWAPQLQIDVIHPHSTIINSQPRAGDKNQALEWLQGLQALDARICVVQAQHFRWPGVGVAALHAAAAPLPVCLHVWIVQRYKLDRRQTDGGRNFQIRDPTFQLLYHE